MPDVTQSTQTQAETAVTQQTQQGQSTQTQAIPPFDFGTIPKGDLESYEARIKHDQYSHTKGRVIGELRVKDEAELKELIELGRKAKEMPKEPKEMPPEAKQAIEAMALAEKKLADTNLVYSQKVMKVELANAYLAANGKPNAGDSLTQDQAITLMLAENLFEVDSSFNLVSKSGITVSQAVDLWLKRNSHFAKAGEPPKVPTAPGTQALPIGSGKASANAAIMNWIEN